MDANFELGVNGILSSNQNKWNNTQIFFFYLFNLMSIHNSENVFTISETVKNKK